MTLAIFDFDGTISSKDSFENFILYTHGIPRTLWGILINSPILVAYLLKLVPNGQAKEKIFGYFYRGWEVSKFDELAKKHAREQLPKILRPAALKKLAWHKQQGHKIVVVSASFENYLDVWCRSEGLDLLATRVETKDGKLTGKFASKNCFGEEKVNRIKQIYHLSDFNFIYAYGDSGGDLPLKKIANEFHYKPFRSSS